MFLQVLCRSLALLLYYPYYCPLSNYLEVVWQKTTNKFRVYLKLQLRFLALIAGIPPPEPAKHLAFFQDSFLTSLSSAAATTLPA